MGKWWFVATQGTHEFFFGGVLIQSCQIPSEEDFPVLNGRTSVLGPNRRILVIAAVTSGEHAGCDVVLEQLLVDRVDNIRNNLTDKILAALEDCEIIWRSLDTQQGELQMTRFTWPKVYEFFEISYPSSKICVKSVAVDMLDSTREGRHGVVELFLES